MRKKIVAGNWKMNGRRAFAKELVAAIAAQPVSGCEQIVCTPYPYLSGVHDQLSGSALKLGAQNVSEQEDGAFTGEVSAEMLADCGCDYVLVGHSERRSLYGESDQVVADKFVRALDSGITPILCLGETLEERESGATEKVVARQLDAVVAATGIAAFARAVIAYEPVWAIGTGLTASPQQAQEVHAFIRQKLAKEDVQIAAGVSILYGGSVKADNAAALFAGDDIDGGLIGGASLDADSFLAICKATTK
ncbi:MAG: triose-phosphate isomerase [Gammaproteobacteria bacterium]|nr:triose-phosphate isomerase [Gammaproteobacteria bacterium]MBQ0773235.1 triose-phosphate isomerase [Gammaproteobacteria bacterium]